MKQIAAIEEWVKSPWFQMSAFAVGIIGIATAILIYLFTRRYKRMWYAVRSFTLVERDRSTVPGLEVLFDKKAVEALTISKIAVWNSGSDPLRKEDFPQAEPICINVGKKLEILEASIIQTSSRTCGCAIVRKARNCFEIGFEFLDPNDGLVVQIAHTGTSSQEVNVTGHIVGGGKVTRPGALWAARY